MASSTMEADTTNIALVMVPLPAQGHLNPFLHLSAELASRHIHVHYVSSATHNRQARLRLQGRDLSSHSISPYLHFHDLNFPSSLPPSSSDTTINTNNNNNIKNKFPSHLQPSFNSSSAHLLTHLTSLLLSLSSSHRRIALLHDCTMSFANAAATSFPNVEPFSFEPSSAIATAAFLGLAPELSPAPFHSLFSDEFLRWVRATPASVHGRLLNTSVVIEDEFIRRLSSGPAWNGQRIFAVGPLHPTAPASGSVQKDRHGCLGWLEMQPEASVVYVSFGTTSTMSREQVREILAGLAASGHRFICARLEPDLCDIFEGGDHLEGEEDLEFVEWEERAKGRGLVLRGWAPQLEILMHRSTGGFVSHCGWNSCMEALTGGVPILAWPMHSDQPINALLLTRILRTALALTEQWTSDDQLVTSVAVKVAVDKLMVGDEGRASRNRAREISQKLRDAARDDGASKLDLESFISHLCRH